jgi:hypothetical protein
MRMGDVLHCYRLRNDLIHKAGHSLFLRMRASQTGGWVQAGYQVDRADERWCDSSPRAKRVHGSESSSDALLGAPWATPLHASSLLWGVDAG